MQAFFILYSALALVGATALPANGRKSTLDPLPEGSPDGLYMSNLNDDGSTRWEYVGQGSVASNSTSTPSLDKRASTGAYCTGGYIPSQDWHTAANGLMSNCGNGLDFSRAVSYQSGGAVAYGCNYGNGQTCHSWDLAGFYANLAESCGTNQASWWSEDDWKASYGVNPVGQGFC